MGFSQAILSQPRPDRVRSVKLPRRSQSHPSPADWRDEIIYFFLPDRFSDGNEAARPLLDPANAAAGRPADFRFDQWAAGGRRKVSGRHTHRCSFEAVVHDPSLNASSAPGNPWSGASPFFEVVANSAEVAAGAGYAGTHPVGSQLPVQIRDGIAFVSLRDVGPSEVIVLNNRP